MLYHAYQIPWDASSVICLVMAKIHTVVEWHVLVSLTMTARHVKMIRHVLIAKANILPIQERVEDGKWKSRGSTGKSRKASVVQ